MTARAERKYYMTELVIDRAKWLRGSGDSVMRDHDGRMCCLGFDAVAAGVSPCDIVRCTEPRDIENIDHYPDYRESRLYARAVHEAMRINDDPLLTDADRERQLTPVLMSFGWDAVWFVGDGRP